MLKATVVYCKEQAKQASQMYPSLRGYSAWLLAPYWCRRVLCAKVSSWSSLLLPQRLCSSAQWLCVFCYWVSWLLNNGLSGCEEWAKKTPNIITMNFLFHSSGSNSPKLPKIDETSGRTQARSGIISTLANNSHLVLCIYQVLFCLKSGAFFLLLDPVWILKTVKDFRM